jgi:hypothetical protein
MTKEIKLGKKTINGDLLLKTNNIAEIKAIRAMAILINAKA